MTVELRERRGKSDVSKLLEGKVREEENYIVELRMIRYIFNQCYSCGAGVMIAISLLRSKGEKAENAPDCVCLQVSTPDYRRRENESETKTIGIGGDNKGECDCVCERGSMMMMVMYGSV